MNEFASSKLNMIQNKILSVHLQHGWATLDTKGVTPNDSSLSAGKNVAHCQSELLII